MPKIKIEYKNEILGSGVFWEGDSKNIEDIPNYPARIAALRAIKLNKTYRFGMWIASIIS